MTARSFSSWVYYCKISTFNALFVSSGETGFSSWVYYCKISTVTRWRRPFQTCSFSSWVYYCKISTFQGRLENKVFGFSSWVYYCKISTRGRGCGFVCHLVSVAEFITVRFQRVHRDIGSAVLSVSVAEFITVRFQRMRSSLMISWNFWFQ